MAWELVYIYLCMELASESVWALGWGLRLASELVCHQLA